MILDSTAVGLWHCPNYDRGLLMAAVERLTQALSFRVASGSRVLVKPNLVAAAGLACTHPEVVAAVVEWLLAQGAIVTVGDSPAFGKAGQVMRATGIGRALQGLPVAVDDFSKVVPLQLASGVKMEVARAALECDLLLNLPKLKAHSQLLVTLGVKNYFGVVTGWQKPLLHMRYGHRDQQFPELLVDLLAVVPSGLTILDGVVAMERTGPLRGDSCPLALLAGSRNPVALDTAIIHTLGIERRLSPVAEVAWARELAGSRPETINYPLLAPDSWSKCRFATPWPLKPVTFHPWQLLTGSIKRLVGSGS